MKKIMNIIVSMITMANVIGIATVNAHAEGTETVFNISEVVAKMKEVGRETESMDVYYRVDDEYQIYFEYKMNYDKDYRGNHEYTTWFMKNGSAVGIDRTTYI